MNPIQRSWAYVSRKRLRSFILFLILLVLLAGISACLTLMKSNKTVESNLYKSLNTSFSIKKIENGQTFKLSDLASVSKIKGLENVSPELETVAKLKDKEAVTGEQSVERDDLSAADNNLVSLTALEDSSKDVTFTSSAFNLKEGRHLQKGDSKKILIHEELAKKNGLSLHDKIGLDAGQSESGKGQTVEFEIIGIFSGKKQEKFTGLSSDFSENQVFTDYESSQTLLGNSEAQVSAAQVSAARFYVENPKEMDGLMKQVENLALENQGYQVEKENKAFEQIKDSVATFQTFLTIFLYGMLIAGAGALILVLSLWLRERVYEVGILLALGKGKSSIFLQFCLEVVLVSLGALLPAFVAGNGITTYLLQTLLASGDQVSLQDTLAKASSLSTSILSFAESYVFLVLLSCLSVALCFLFLFRKSPKEILSSIS
ncbi:ABC transporter permease [Streptococcus pneumoniae]|uniref:ABC transporter permease n=3 Tax=Streptococcus pneumoniae TaxID=1313 RepID=A0A8B5XMC3_STREE|nr:ABC transporter permease [Streptococcus pneumoniae]TVW60786.1 ABC transporter permease [Streptococcus pneumoniae]